VVDAAENTTKRSFLRAASHHCANWDAGNCLGCMMKTEKKVIIFKISHKLSNKPCIVNSGCEYFNNVVVPGISNGR